MWNLLVLAAAIATASDTPPPVTTRPLFSSEVTLVGGRPSASVIIETREGESPTVRLDWRSSGMLARSESTLTLALAGAPLVTKSLTELENNAGRGTVEVPLGTRPPGFHELTVSARLVVADDPCLERYRSEAWIVVEPSSEVISKRGAVVTSLETLPARWRAPDGARPTQVTVWPRFVLDAQGARAWMVGDQLLRSWGVRPKLSPSPPSGPSLQLAALPGPSEPVWQGLAEALATAPDAQAAVLAEGASVFVLGRDGDGVAHGLRGLSSDALRRRCPLDRACLIGPQRPRPVAPKSSEAANSTVLSLAELDDGKGWRASGEGRHQLSFRWSPPATWDIEAPPVLTLLVRGSGARALARERSVLTVAINDVPAASYSLTELRDQLTRMRFEVPKALWSEREWRFDVTVSLRAHDDSPCGRDDDAVWLAIDSRSRLDVARTEREFRGIARFARDSAPVAVVIGDQLSWKDLVDLGAVVFALGPETREQLRWIASEELCPARCLVPRRADARGAQLIRTRAAAHLHWLDTEGTMEIPLLPARVAALELRTSEDSELLDIFSGTEPAARPVLEALAGTAALWDGQTWISTTPQGPPLDRHDIEAAVPRAGPAATSERARARRWVDRATVAGSVLLVLAIFLWVGRSRRRARRLDKGLEHELGRQAQ
jgi:hypothetical protein